MPLQNLRRWSNESGLDGRIALGYAIGPKLVRPLGLLSTSAERSARLLLFRRTQEIATIKSEYCFQVNRCRRSPWGSGQATIEPRTMEQVTALFEKHCSAQ